ncbi:glutamate-5-semialdehyde dehydrogenase [Neisseria sp. Ec49-e6-T10]|uniref:glutamate-5-semialdehyde dehydrogenase n=1 Tax=Neisseria sp. Ec49-e6-T10 TaxID=3140744 RepID=UPI003EBB0450
MLEQMGKAAKEAAYQLAQCTTAQKNTALRMIADSLEANSEQILQANRLDIQFAQENGISDAMQDRLLLTKERIAAIAHDVRKVCLLSDPIGSVMDGCVLESGLNIQRKRVPLGVIGVIYEARPNVTIDVASLCLKTGNAVILRGGKETIHTNKEMTLIVQQALRAASLPEKAIQSIENPDRQWINALLKLDQYVDMLIPRGGAKLHQLCKENSTIPVIVGGIGICHTFVDESADFSKALDIIQNAKTQRPSTCNTLETLLVHENIAHTFLPLLSQRMAECKVSLHAKDAALALLQKVHAKVEPLKENELYEEWLSLDLNVMVVTDLNAALEHIRTYSSKHSDAILTKNVQHAEKFVQVVDSAAVYVNASTRFTDGAQFGLGAEVAVSTQKLHARGPMGLEALTTYKWIGYGEDLIRS